ncbi:putative transposase subunit A [Pseudomonas aeruginosa VRFPA02]|nr:putative transposase subunit A [Pseudomonas aeruginosa VRFPA02]
MVLEHLNDYPSEWAAIEAIAPKIGCAAQTCNVRMTWPRLMPCNPARRINRSTVHLATSVPSRRSCFQTFIAP